MKKGTMLVEPRWIFWGFGYTLWFAADTDDTITM